MEDRLHRLFNRARIGDRQLNELIGVARGLVADGRINQAEAEYLQTWLAANEAVIGNPVVSTLLQRVDDILSDGVLDQEEARELFETLHNFAGGDMELGEVLKSTRLPLDQPPPAITFDSSSFCFTGTFAFGSRKDCENAVAKLGGQAGSLNKSTDYLVIGIYATDSWAHSTFGRKIEKAVSMKNSGQPIAIVGEEHWLSFLD